MDKFSLLEQAVVKPEFCVGCGTCVSVCDYQSIAMRFDASGKYEAYFSNQTNCISCGLCVKVCPFYSCNSDEDEIASAKIKENGASFKEETGYYLKSYVGHADQKVRLNSSSGGSLSQILKWLLDNNLVDKVVTVEGTAQADKLFQYTVIDNSADIDRCAKSAYYPVEISSVLEIVRQADDLRFAIVGLPCFAKAIELAKQTCPALNKNIHFVLGLVCGQTKSKKYTEFLISDVGVQLEEVQKVNFRHKVPGCKSSNFGFKVETDGKEKVKMFNEGVGTIWINDFAKLNSCYYCDDVFAECADAVFMDAWLPEYTQDSAGTSLVINRNLSLSNFFSENRYEEISIDKVINSQQGVLKNKRAFRTLYDSLALPNIAPRKRSFLGKIPVSASEIKHQKQKFNWASQSRLGDIKVQRQIVKKMERATRRGRIKRAVGKLLRIVKVKK